MRSKEDRTRVTTSAVNVVQQKTVNCCAPSSPVRLMTVSRRLSLKKNHQKANRMAAIDRTSVMGLFRMKSMPFN